MLKRADYSAALAELLIHDMVRLSESRSREEEESWDTASEGDESESGYYTAEEGSDTDDNAQKEEL